LGSGEGKQVFRSEGDGDKRKSLNSKLIFLVPAIGYAVGLGQSSSSHNLRVVWVTDRAIGGPMLRHSPVMQNPAGEK
jgi:hypothetical protein